MLIFLIVCGIAALLGLILGLPEGGFLTGIGYALGGAFWGAWLALFLCLIVGPLAYNGAHWEKQPDVPLVSLADGARIHGSFFLGSGTVDSEPTYTWYQQNGVNNFVRRDVPASEATIHYTMGSEKPHYVKTKQVDDAGPGKLKDWGFNFNDAYDEKYDFYVPKGSIVQRYTLDNR